MTLTSLNHLHEEVDKYLPNLITPDYFSVFNHLKLAIHELDGTLKLIESSDFDELL